MSPPAAQTPAGAPGATALTPEGRLLFGDSLEWLEKLDLHEVVRCVFIDPPYNTGLDDKPYADHRADWLGFMAPRLALLRRALRPDGSLFVQVDDNELDGLKLALDELFGREAFVARITVDARSPSAFSTVNRGLFKASEYILWYCRDRQAFRWNPQRVPREPDPAYDLWLENPEAPPSAWTFTRKKLDPEVQVREASRVARLAPVSPTKSGAPIREALAASAQGVVVVERPGREPQYAWKGNQLVFYEKQVSVVDGVRTATRPLTNIWTDIAWEGIANEGGVRYKQGKKPEKLLRRCLALATDPGDRVLDCFLGAGTTAAVAHKMRRSWIGIEEAPGAFALARERLERVVRGEDPTGVSRVESWRGGGSFTER